MTRDDLECQILTKHGIRKIVHLSIFMQFDDDIHIVFGHMKTSETSETSEPVCTAKEVNWKSKSLKMPIHLNFSMLNPCLIHDLFLTFKIYNVKERKFLN